MTIKLRMLFLQGCQVVIMWRMIEKGREQPDLTSHSLQKESMVANSQLSSNYHVVIVFLSLFPNKPWFLCVCSISLLKTLWEKEKLLIPTLYSTILENILPLSSNLNLSSADSLSLEESKILR